MSTESAKPLGLGLSEGLGLVPTRAVLDDLAAQALAQMGKAEDFPNNTCGASRHVALLAEAILRGDPCPQLADEPQHCAESMAWTVASLWYARTEVARLSAEVADAKRAMRAYARQNPRHEYQGATQDPNGVHAWLARNGA
jgi:hypothetical protein